MFAVRRLACVRRIAVSAGGGINTARRCIASCSIRRSDALTGAAPTARAQKHSTKATKSTAGSSAGGGGSGAASAAASHLAIRQRELNALIAERASSGWTPYPTHGFTPTHTIRDVLSHPVAASGVIAAGARSTQVVSVAGRIVVKRAAGARLIFFDIQSDGQRLQIIAAAGKPNSKSSDSNTASASAAAAAAASSPSFDAELFRVLRRGDIIGVTGVIGRAQSGTLSIYVTADDIIAAAVAGSSSTPALARGPAARITLLAPCLHDIPLQLTEPDIKYRYRYLDLLVQASTHAPTAPKQTTAAAAAPANDSAVNTAAAGSVDATTSSRAAFITRARIISSIRRFLDERDFLEVETPVLWPKHGGATARPFVTHSRILGTGLPLHLRVAPELFLKQLVVGGLNRVYELGKVYRNEGIDPTHNPEFTSVEFYAAYSDYEKLMTLTEQMIRSIVQTVQGTGNLNVTTNVKGDKGDERAVIDFAQPFARIDIVPTLERELNTTLPTDWSSDAARQQLIDICSRKGIKLTAPLTTARIIDKLIGVYIEPRCVQPTFLIHHPTILSPLAASHPTRPSVTQRFELFVGGYELANSYTELNDPAEQRRRLLQQSSDAVRAGGDDETQLPDEDFCVALEHGLPPTAGWGLGVDRLCMLLTNTNNIRDVLLFPILKPDVNPSATAAAAATANRS